MDTSSNPAVQPELPLTPPMHPLQYKVLMQNLEFMRGIVGLEFAVLMPNGESIIHGNVSVKVTKPKAKHTNKDGTARRRSIYPVGELSAWLKANGLLGIKPGAVLDIPVGKFPIPSVQSMIANMATEVWGKKSVTTQRGDGHVTVLRAY